MADKRMRWQYWLDYQLLHHNVAKIEAFAPRSGFLNALLGFCFFSSEDLGFLRFCCLAVI